MNNSALVLKNTPLQQVKCINKYCQSDNTGLIKANQFVCNYYNVKYTQNKMVCSSCLSTCLKNYRRINDKFKAGECIMDTICPIYKPHKEREDEEKEKIDSIVTLANEHVTAYNVLFDNAFKQNEHLLNNQLSLCTEYIDNRINTLDSEFNKFDEFIKKIENDISELKQNVCMTVKNQTLHQPSTEPSVIKLNNKMDNVIRITHSPSISTLHLEPNIGVLEYPPLHIGQIMYGMPLTTLQPWYRCKIIDILEEAISLDFGSYKKKLLNQHVAFSTISPVQFIVGSRIISKYKDLNSNEPEQYYAGIIAEPPISFNKFRYLIFFDNGHSQYQNHSNIHLVVRNLKYVWDDVNPGYRDYIKHYIKLYPKRFMKIFIKDTYVEVLYQNGWVSAKVIDVDASLVKLYFETQNRYELLYRGSPRFKINIENNGDLGNNVYMTTFPEDIKIIQSNNSVIDCTNIKEEPTVKMSKNVSRKRTANKTVAKTTNRPKRTTTNVASTSTATVEMNDNTPLLSLSNNNDTNSEHECNRSCIDKIAYDYKNTKTLNSLAVPLRFGYKRYIKQCIKSYTNTVIYETPCGRAIDNISEMYNYLISTESEMTIDQFSFESFLNPKCEFKIVDNLVLIKDISEGQEDKPIPCVNRITYQLPRRMNYLINRQPIPNVSLNVDSDFLCGCDCTDNCADKLNCACWQMTRDAQKNSSDSQNHENIGYSYRRLLQVVSTGIYECNKFCKCSSSCLNRVVQQRVTQKLQLYMTEKKGWGVRCLNDIPKGSFICCYVGNVLTETEALKVSKMYGDQYLADLDFIETVEKIKCDYESDVYEIDPENSETMNVSNKFKKLSHSSGAGFVVTNNNGAKNDVGVATTTTSQLRKWRKASNNDNSKKHCYGNASSNSIRRFYGRGEDMMYKLDASMSGNIGCYLNHSCSPNMFMQNVFVDTHDLRFPWVTFFALKNIPAGEELTWDYRYIVNSVPGQVMRCYCESSNCRGRLF